MKYILPTLLAVSFVFACSGPQKKEDEQLPLSKPKKTQSAKESAENQNLVDQYVLILRHVDNQVIIYINDSTIFDTGVLTGGPYEREIDLTEYVEAEKTNLKVELYNTNPPTETMRPGWMIVYDIFINDQLVDFIREKRNESREGLVYTETHDLSDIW